MGAGGGRGLHPTKNYRRRKLVLHKSFASLGPFKQHGSVNFFLIDRHGSVKFSRRAFSHYIYWKINCISDNFFFFPFLFL